MTSKKSTSTRKKRVCKKIGPNKKTKHHMVPLCRLSLEQITNQHDFSRGNIKYVQWKLHQAWHDVFDTLSPYEAVLLVIRELAPPGYFTQAEIRVQWRHYSHQFKLLGENSEVDLPPRRKSANREQAWKTLFGNRDWVDVIAQIVYVWSPIGYFQYVNVVGETDSGRNTFVCNAESNK